MLNRMAASRCQVAFSKALPGKLYIKRHSSCILYLLLPSLGVGLVCLVIVLYAVLVQYAVLGILSGITIISLATKPDCFTFIVFLLSFGC